MLSFSYKTRTAEVNLMFWGKEKGNLDQNDCFSQKKIISELYHFSPVLFLTQVHGNQIIECKSSNTGLFWGEADSAFTKAKDLPIIIRTADCIPILFSCNDLVAGIHAGWRGLDNQIIYNCINLMIESYSCRLEDFIFFIGPHIRQKSYEVSEDVYSRFHKKYALSNQPKKALLDLSNIAVDQILSFGFQDSQLNLINDDTYQSDDWYSHRNAEKGRNLAIISLSR